MNDFLKAMGQFGMEGLGIEPAEVSLEQEMNEEIAMEAELDEAYAQMDFANIVASTSQCEAILTAMAEREIGLESNAGRDADVIYGEFGLEAIKDVAMRKAYSGLASLKALINTCINWLKQLVGISVASKKIFAGLAKKAKAMGKQLGKVQVKVSEKLKRDMPDYAKALTELNSKYTSNYSRGKDNNLSTLKEAEATTLDPATDFMKEQSKKYTDLNEALKDIYDKADTTDYEGSACYTTITKAVKSIETIGNANKSVDMAKNFDKEIKALENLRKEIDKKDAKVKAPESLNKYINAEIVYATKMHNYAKSALKMYVKVADDCLTMAKGIYATLV